MSTDDNKRLLRQYYGKPIQVTAVNIDRVVDGRIVEHGGAANLLGPLLDIGAIVINSR